MSCREEGGFPSKYATPFQPRVLMVRTFIHLAHFLSVKVALSPSQASLDEIVILQEKKLGGIPNLQKQLSIILVQCNGRQEANGRSTTVDGRQIKMPNILAFSSKNGQRLIALLEGILDKKYLHVGFLEHTV